MTNIDTTGITEPEVIMFAGIEMIAVPCSREMRDNLERLAAKLQSLPEDYEHFDMMHYLRSGSVDKEKYMLENGGLKGCGTVACAVGHGPSAGILFSKEIAFIGPTKWDIYAAAFCGEHMYNEGWSYLWSFLFSASWALTPAPHHWDAAARIRFYLDEGIVPVQRDSDFWTSARCSDVFGAYKINKRMPFPVKYSRNKKVVTLEYLKNIMND